MKTTILKILKQIEVNENIEILYACEAGSRVWGFSGEDSDYDVKFIYKKASVSDYLSLKSESDVIEYEGDNFDIIGWDIKKALTLHFKDNPQLREWLLSDIIYIDRGISNIFNGLECFDMDILKNHYASIAHSHWKRYSGLAFDRIKIKRYLHIIRAILCWNILNQDSYPPIKIQDLLKDKNIDLSDESKADILNLVDCYSENCNEITEDEIFRINNFILKSLNMMKRVKVNSHKEIEDYDERFREILMIMGDDDV
jgi:predicted nucleotidyltransferase